MNQDNYEFFLKKYREHLSPLLGTYCWSLLPNHFHLLVKMKTYEKIFYNLEERSQETLSITEKKFLSGRGSINELTIHAFRRFFQSYALSFNKAHQRKGNLFHTPFKRVLVEKDNQFSSAVIYIHTNPVRHGLVKDFTKFKWTSWSEYCSSDTTLLLRDEVIDWFGGIEDMFKLHRDRAGLYLPRGISIEEWRREL